jgi:type IV pilus assembly protein PilC
MVTAGLQIQEAIDLLKNQSNNPALSDVLNKIYREIQGGGNLGNALVKYPQYFSRIYIALIRAGESSGTLDVVLARLADNLEKDQEFRTKVRSALIYPAIIVVAMVVVFGVLMTVVVPKLTELYVDFGTDLPLPTRILQGISNFFVHFWWLMIIVAFVGFNLFQRWLKTSWGRHIWDRIMLSLPLLGKLQQQIILVEFTRTLGMLVGAGVHILDSLNILVDSLGNVLYQEALKEISKKVEKGLPLGQLFAQYPMFPPILGQMVKVGEETGKMDESLIKLSTYFESESDHTVKGLTTAIEPLIMIVLGVGVGFIVFAIITPIYNLTNSFK